MAGKEVEIRMMKKYLGLLIMAVYRGQSIPPTDNNEKNFTKSLETTKVRQQIGTSLLKNIYPY